MLDVEFACKNNERFLSGSASGLDFLAGGAAGCRSHDFLENPVRERRRLGLVRPEEALAQGGSSKSTRSAFDTHFCCRISKETFVLCQSALLITKIFFVIFNKEKRLTATHGVLPYHLKKCFG